eukprot:11445076-Heterocapsa_arctica.AAC.1
MARHLLRLLRYLEVRGHFCTDSAYVRTYHNLLNDFLSRETKGEVDLEMTKRGYTRLEASTAWAEILELGYGRRIHALPGVDPEDWQTAAQLAYRRDAADPPRA